MQTKNRTAYMKAPWQFELREIALPSELAEGTALVRIEACSVCGSDLIWSEYGIPGITDWFPIGHEVAGVIEEVRGGGLLKPGDKVVFESSSFCGVCDSCRDNRSDLCKKAPSSWSSLCMGFSDYMLIPVKSLVAYEGLSPDIAALTEPAGVAFDLVRVANIQLGQRVCIVGPGPIALMALSLARHRGAVDVVCIGLPHDKKRLALAEELGAETVVHTGPLDELTRFHGRFDHVLMTAPVKFIPQAMPFLGYEGRMTFLGLAHGGERMIVFDAEDFHFRKLQLLSSFASPAMFFPTVLRLLKTGIIPGEKLISHRFRLADIVNAMAICREDKLNLIKAIVQP